MGIFSEYLERGFNLEDLTQERKKQLRRISERRGGRDVFVYASDLNKPRAPISIAYDDLIPIGDQLSNLHGTKLDVILETPGGSGEVAEDIVRLLHGKYDEVGIIIPGWAKSAGTIIAMAGDEILMEPASALGPIDAQLAWQGKVFSADALLEGMEKIKKEVEATGTLNKAYIPILQAISPGELQSAENTLNFAKQLVTDWLGRYKFKSWDKHSTTGKPVTDEEKKERAKEIAGQLCDHRRWLTHGRSIKISDLAAMGLKITGYSRDEALADAIRRYHVLLQMTFSSNIYKLFETPDSQIIRFIGPQVPPPTPLQPTKADTAGLEVECGRCHSILRIQANLDRPKPIQPGFLPFPADNKLKCPNCANVLDLTDARRQIELQSKKRVVPNGGPVT